MSFGQIEFSTHFQIYQLRQGHKGGEIHIVYRVRSRERGFQTLHVDSEGQK